MKYTREQIENYISRIEFICNGITIDTSGIEMLRQLLAENDALRDDAERYQYTKQNPGVTVARARNKYRAQTSHSVITDWHDSHDEAIDAARKPV